MLRLADLFMQNSHIRLNALTGEQVLVPPHGLRPLGLAQTETFATVISPVHDPSCYLGSDNFQVAGERNSLCTSCLNLNVKESLAPDIYSSVTAINEHDLLVSKPELVIWSLINFSSCSQVTLPELETTDIARVVDLWCKEFNRLKDDERIKYIMIFADKGQINDSLNPYPHAQIRAQATVPSDITKESERQLNYFRNTDKTLIGNYLKLEMAKKDRIIFSNEHFVVLAPYWAHRPHETMLVSKRTVQHITQFTEAERWSLADALKRLTSRYDNLFRMSFPYFSVMHQAPVNSGNCPEWHWHMHFFPALLRPYSGDQSALGYEMLGMCKTVLLPELAAKRLRRVSDLHYKKEL